MLKTGSVQEDFLPILVLNSGSSSIKFSLYESGDALAEPTMLLGGELSGVGSAQAKLFWRVGSVQQERPVEKAETPSSAIHAVLDTVCSLPAAEIRAVGYRVVHPGPKLEEHQRITLEVLRDLEEAVPFAPLHEPEAIKMIRAAMGPQRPRPTRSRESIASKA